MDGIHGCLNGLLTGGGTDSEGVAVGVVVNRKAEIGGRSMQVFEYLGFDGLVLRPRGLFGIAIDVELRLLSDSENISWTEVSG